LELIAVPVGFLYRQLYRDDKFTSTKWYGNKCTWLSNITLRNKVNQQRFYCYFNFDSPCIAMINEHASYPKMGVKRSLSWSWTVLCVYR